MVRAVRVRTLATTEGLERGLVAEGVLAGAHHNLETVVDALIEFPLLLGHSGSHCCLDGNLCWKCEEVRLHGHDFEEALRAAFLSA